MNPKVTQLLQDLRVSTEVAQGFLQKVHGYQQHTTISTLPVSSPVNTMVPNGNGILTGDN